MNIEITPIHLPLPFNISEVHCYLLKNDSGFFLIDTGHSSSRRRLHEELNQHGCVPGKLKMIILTHGDFDHTGNAIYLRQRTGGQIAMHESDRGMLENGDMFWNREFHQKFLKGVMQLALPFKQENRGRADIFLKDGESLQPVGLDAMVYNTPGHSNGSICILTSGGDLFCGDLFTNSTGKPMLNQMLYDRPAGNASLERLKLLPIRTVFPGHGASFSWDRLE